MSNHVTSLVRKRDLGIGLTKKSVLLYMADLASDDGSGIWASKATMARELETTERTIQRTIQSLMDAGFVSQGGRKKHQNGYTVDYKIEVERVLEISSPPTHRHPRHTVTPDTPSPHPRHTVTPRPDTPSPKPNITIHEPQLTKERARKRSIPEDAIISQKMLEIAQAEQVSEPEAKAQFQRFKDNALANAKTYANWDAAWRNWLRSPYFKPITTGGRNAATRPDAQVQSIFDAAAAHRP